MEWIKGIQRALDYVEEHLTEEIDYEAVAKEACSSAFHFQRVFRILCGFSHAPLPVSMGSRPRRQGGAGTSNPFPDCL